MTYQLAEIVDKLTPDREPYPKSSKFYLCVSLSQISSLGSDWALKIKNLKIKDFGFAGLLAQSQEFIGEVDQFIEGLINRPSTPAHKILANLDNIVLLTQYYYDRNIVLIYLVINLTSMIY